MADTLQNDPICFYHGSFQLRVPGPRPLRVPLRDLRTQFGRGGARRSLSSELAPLPTIMVTWVLAPLGGGKSSSFRGHCPLPLFQGVYGFVVQDLGSIARWFSGC